MPVRRIRALAEITPDSPAKIRRYSIVARRECADLVMELDLAAAEFEAALAAQKGAWWAMGFDVKWKARRTAARLRRAKQAADEAGRRAERFYPAFTRAFAEMLPSGQRMQGKPTDADAFAFDDETDEAPA